DERLEKRPVEVETAHHCVDRLLMGQAPRIPANVHDACVATTGDYEQALVLDVDDQRLVVEDEGVGLPPPAQPRLLWREPRFVAGRAGHFSGDENRPVEQEAGMALFHYVEPRVD